MKHLLLTLKLLETVLAEIVRNKSVGSDGVPGEILRLAGEPTTPFLAGLLEISLNNATISSD